MTDSHPLILRAGAFILKERLLNAGCSLLAGVSGGPDSVALLHAMVALRETLELDRITILHFNHRLRGRASDEDQAFVTQLAGKLGLDCLTDSEDVRGFAEQNGISLEMAGRQCRHRFFQEVLTSGLGERLALAHTANDQAEELCLRLFRGTGPSGMAGMPPKTAKGVIRPLLFAWRRDILEYLRARGYDFREDASNREPFCRRNALRIEVIPLIERHFHGKVLDTIVRHAELARDEESWWQEQIGAHWSGVCREESPGRLVLARGALKSLHPALQRRMLRRAIERLQGHLQRIYAVHVEALRELTLGSGAARLDLPKGLRAQLEGEGLILRKEEEDGPEEPAPTPPPATFEGPGGYRFPDWEWTLKLVSPNEAERPVLSGPHGGHSAFEAHLDADTLLWPLQVRTWLPGDRFMPLGLKGMKKLQDFFVDGKVERNRRARIPLLCDREKICWIAGLRIDERVKVTPLTRSVLAVRLVERRADGA